ncbi:MAG: glutaredoxin family protein [Planctomycetota bacterium]
MNASIDFLNGHTLTVYSATWCPDCTRLEQWMASRKVPHENVMIDQRPEAAEKLESETGKQAVPFILVNGRTWVRGYHKEERSRFSEAKLLEELKQAVG